MIVEDKIYGIDKIDESILVDLINCNSVQRLKGISQLGMPDKYNYRKGFSRYEHSLGVLILLKKLGANLEEQVAGLLHDVSHTAFSHVVDWVVGNPNEEDYQDKIHENIIKNSEIPLILKKYGLDYRKISNLSGFNLLERPIPGLCADRIDYSLRDISNEFGLQKAKKFFKNLKKINNQIVFNDQVFAEEFAQEYIFLQKNHWAGDQARSRYYLLSEILSKGLAKKIISLEDFRKDDDYILSILENSKDVFIKEKLKLLKNGFKTVDSTCGIKLEKKFRYIDPEVSFKNNYKKLSDLSSSYFKALEIEKENSSLIRKIEIYPILK